MKKTINLGRCTEPTEPLFTRTEVENTPFVIISHEDTHFGTFGKFKITEDYLTLEQCKTELEKITWNRLVQIISLVVSLLNEKSK